MATLESITGPIESDNPNAHYNRFNYSAPDKLTFNEFLYLYMHADTRWKDSHRPDSMVMFIADIANIGSQLLFIRDFKIIGAINIQQKTINFCRFKKGLFYFEINSVKRSWDGIHAPKCVAPSDTDFIRGSKIGADPFITTPTWSTNKLVISNDRSDSRVILRESGQLHIKTIAGRVVNLISCYYVSRLGEWVFITKGPNYMLHNIFTQKTIPLESDVYERYIVTYNGASVFIGKTSDTPLHTFTVWYLDELDVSLTDLNVTIPKCTYYTSKNTQSIAEIINRQFSSKNRPQRYRLQIFLNENCDVLTPEALDQAGREYACLFVKRYVCFVRNEIKEDGEFRLRSSRYICNSDYSSIYPLTDSYPTYNSNTIIDRIYFRESINDRIHEMYSDINTRFYGIEKKKSENIKVEEKLELTNQQKKEKKKLEKDRRRNQRFQNKKFRTR